MDRRQMGGWEERKEGKLQWLYKTNKTCYLNQTKFSKVRKRKNIDSVLSP